MSLHIRLNHAVLVEWKKPRLHIRLSRSGLGRVMIMQINMVNNDLDNSE
jgi:hypothetical protein